MQITQHQLAIFLNIWHEWTRQKRWDKPETQEYMLHFNALNSNSSPRIVHSSLMLIDGTRVKKRTLQILSYDLNFETEFSHL